MIDPWNFENICLHQKLASSLCLFINTVGKNSITQFNTTPLLVIYIHVEILHTLSMQASKQIINKEYVPGNVRNWKIRNGQLREYDLRIGTDDSRVSWVRVSSNVKKKICTYVPSFFE